MASNQPARAAGAVVLLSVSFGLFMRWLTPPFAETLNRHPNGRIAAQSHYKRDWRGRLHVLKGTWCYSNGQMSYEEIVDPEVDEAKSRSIWSPDGEPITLAQLEAFIHADNGDGTFGPPKK